MMGTDFAHREVSRKAKFRVTSLTNIRAARHSHHMPTAYHIHLKAHRKARKLTLEQVANEIGVRFNTVSGWESGARTLDLEDLEKLAALYGVHPAALLLAPEEGPMAEAMRRASDVARRLPKESAADWLNLGERLLPKEPES